MDAVTEVQKQLRFEPSEPRLGVLKRRLEDQIAKEKPMDQPWKIRYNEIVADAIRQWWNSAAFETPSLYAARSTATEYGRLHIGTDAPSSDYEHVAPLNRSMTREQMERHLRRLIERLPLIPFGT